MWKSVVLQVLFCASALLQAQSISGSLSGFVQDSSGGRVSQASIVIANLGNNSGLQVRSGEDGTFRVPSIASGEYRVTIQAPGFSKYVVEAMSIIVGQNLALNATLLPEVQVQEITVSASRVPDIDVDSGSTGKCYGAAEMNDLPNIPGGQGRNFERRSTLRHRLRRLPLLIGRSPSPEPGSRTTATRLIRTTTTKSRAAC